MQVKTALARTIDEADKPTLDATAKRILSNKYILAWIMSACVEEYKGLDIREIAERYIEGEPKVASVSVHRDESGETIFRNDRDNGEPVGEGETGNNIKSVEDESNDGNADKSCVLETETIHGIDTVEKSETEHNTLYDVLFYTMLPNSSEKIGMFVNVEAQSVHKLKYPLIKRSIYYGSRMISAQFQRDFADGDYGKLKKVYSIWICANVPDKLDNTITKYSLTEQQILGYAEEERKNYDLLNVIMVRFNDNKLITVSSDESDDHDTDCGIDLKSIRTGEAPEDLVRMLRYLFTAKNGKPEKKRILEEAYNIPMTRELEEEVEKMCNLSQGISDKSFEKGMQQGMAQGVLQVAIELLKMKLPTNNIIAATKLTLEQLNEIAQENGLELVAE